MIKLNQQLVCILLLGIFWTLPISAISIQQRINHQTYNIPRIQQQMLIDGNIDEEAWLQSLIIELGIETNPGENIKAPVKTIAYLFEDGVNIYVAFKAEDKNPSQIRAHFHDHDQIFEDDLVGFKVDTYNDGLRAYQFFANALGVKHDSIEDDVAKVDDASWNAVWAAASKITADGYQVEFAIPLSILRFDDSKPEQEWGFDLLRFYPRELHHRISYHKVDRNISCDLCQNAILKGFKDVDEGENFSIVPFMTATDNQHRDNPITDEWNESGADTDFGADIRWGISTDTTLNATINPDFSQVEADVAQLDINNNFSLFFAEKRPFFLEGADYYNSLMDLVHTRNISDPDYGMKLTHSSNDNNFAAFIANDTQTNYILPGSTRSTIATVNTDSINGAFRYRHDLANTSSIGTMVVLREADNYHNYVYGVDGLIRFSDSDVLRGQILQSDTEDPDEIVTKFARPGNNSSGSAIEFFYKHQERDWIYWGRYSRLAEGFRADMGFEPRVNFNRYVTGVRRFWYASNEHWWNTLTAGFDTRNSYDLDGDIILNWINTTVSYQGPMQSEIELNVERGEQSWKDVVYDTSDIKLSIKLTPISGLALNLSTSKEKTIDFVNSQSGDLFSLSPNITLNLGEHFQSQIRYTHQKMDVAGGELFKTRLIDARFIYQFSVESFIRLVVQYNDTERNKNLYINNIDENRRSLGTQLLYSYKINPQTVFFLGYSDSAFEDDNMNKLQKTDKTLFLKMSYSWLR